MPTTDLFLAEKQDDVLVITPTRNLGEVDYRAIESEARSVLELLEAPEIKGAVLDLQRTDYFGSTAIAVFVRMWMRVSRKPGRMAICNVSEHEREILLATQLSDLWPICQSREEALRAVRGEQKALS